MNRYKIFIGLIGLEIYCLLIGNSWDGERGGGSVKKIPPRRPTTGHFNIIKPREWGGDQPSELMAMKRRRRRRRSS